MASPAVYGGLWMRTQAVASSWETAPPSTTLVTLAPLEAGDAVRDTFMSEVVIKAFEQTRN